MALQKSLVQPFRRNMLLVGAGWRAYYAPYNISLGEAVASTTQGPKILDLNQGPFTDAALVTAGWTDVGWIKDFQIGQESKIGKVRSGYRGAVRSLYRGQVGENLQFKFREMSRMALKIANGTDVFNLLRATTPSTTGPVSGGTTSDPVTVAMVTYTAATPSLTVATGSGALFAANDLIVCDKDYDGSSYGLLGENATPVFNGAVTDTDYIRKTSDFVARVVSVASDVLTLDQAFVGGGSGNPTANAVPQSGSKVQRIRGFASREGGTYVSEWSGLFLMDTVDQGQIAVYYPHLANNGFRGIMPWALEDAGSTDETGNELDCSQESMAFDDPVDGQTVVGYRAYYPPRGASISI